MNLEGVFISSTQQDELVLLGLRGNFDGLLLIAQVLVASKMLSTLESKILGSELELMHLDSDMVYLDVVQLELNMVHSDFGAFGVIFIQLGSV